MENINYDFSNKDELKKYIMTNIQEYDLRINKLKEEIFELIFTNIPEDRKNSNAEVPIVRSENSDFQLLKTKKSKIYQEIRNIQKQLTISSIHSNEDVLKLNLKKQNLEQELLFINENPKKYLRYIEAKNLNYSNVENEDVRIIIKCKLDELSTLIKQKSKLSKIYPLSEVKVKKYSPKEEK